MSASSVARLRPSTQDALLGFAPRKTLRVEVDERVERVRIALHESAGYGFACSVAQEMGWRAEHRSREVNRTDNLSVETVYADLLLHERRGEWVAVDEITAALIGGLRTTTMQVTPGSVIKVFEEAGQLTLRFDR